MSENRFTNRQLAEIFQHIADLLEIKGEVIYKTLAYRKASDSLRDLGQDAYGIWQQGKLTEIPGVGKAIAEKIDELYTTGKLSFLEKLEAEVPPGLVEVLQVPDVGPKKAALFWKELGVTDLAGLEKAARSGELRQLPGMGEKSEVRIIAGIEALGRRSSRTPLGAAWPFAQELMAELRAVPGVQAVEAGGSLRRMRAHRRRPGFAGCCRGTRTLVMQAFVNHPAVVRVVSQGETKASVEYDRDLRAQLWVHPPERFGTALQYATGSKDHNVRMRELALKKGLSLSDQSFTRQDGSEILCGDEEDVYRILGLPWIPPELREDRGEIKAALAGELPELIQVTDIKAELHSHSTWSDGKLSIRQMAGAALDRGLKVLAVTDHSVSLGVAGGLKIEELEEQRAEIELLRGELGDSPLLLQGAEIEIRADGTLDYPDEVLAKLDIVIASLHSSLRQPREQVTARLLNAIRNPHVDIIAHPTGRMIPNREGADLDMEAVFAAASEHGVALEINAHPSRLDLDDVYSRRAIELGIPISINTDAHSDSDLDLLFFGIATARRAWVRPENVINCWGRERLLAWLAARG